MKVMVAVRQKSDWPLLLCFRNIWVFEFEMDCSATEDGWFDVKGFMQYINTSSSTHVDGVWEGITIQAPCTGNANVGQPPYSNVNHLAKCGYNNTYSWDSTQCEINILN